MALSRRGVEGTGVWKDASLQGFSLNAGVERADSNGICEGSAVSGLGVSDPRLMASCPQPSWGGIRS